jgi:hypothetical protein
VREGDLGEHDGLVSVLEEVTGALVAPIERDRVTCLQTSHQIGQRLPVWAQKEMKMVIKQRPGKTIRLGLDEKLGQSSDKCFSVDIIEKDLAPLDPSGDHVL